MKLLVVGAGAVGSLLAARFSAAGYAVEAVARPEHAAAIRARGLRVEGTSPGTFYPTAIDDLGEAAPADAVLLTVKTFDLATASERLARRFPDGVPTLLPQNGLGLERTVLGAIRAAVGTDATPFLVRASNSIPVTLVGPGVVRQAGIGEIVLRDPARGGPARHADAQFVALFDRAGIPLRLVDDLERELWRKALVNAAINPVTALHRIPNGRVLELPYREEATALLREAQRAAALAGFDFPDDEADADFVRVARATAENRSSMLQDRDRGRPTEVDAISGELLRVASERGVALPRTRSVVERLRAASGRRGAEPS